MASLGNRDIRGEDQTNEVDEQRERARDEGVGGSGEEEEMDELGGRREPDRRGREVDLEADGDSDHGKELMQAEELFGVDEEHLNDIVSKYAKIHQPVPFSSQTPKWRLNLEWHNVNYKVVIPLPPKSFIARMLLKLPIPASITNRFKKKREVPILNNVSGHVHAGQVVAIMGPTGSGKTTLLNVLAQRIKSNVTGEVLVNGEVVKGRRFKRRMAYVLQDDIFFPKITVRNTVRDAAYLKLPKKMSWKEKREKVEDVLTEMGLQRCSNTIVGGAWVRGVSGGERKRTNIATEIVSNPSLIFLDEPTSGLDAATSLGLIVSLKTLAKSGHTVVTTIHQPSSAMFMMFDKVLLMAEGGWVVYSGSAREIMNYFNSLGLYAPSTYNPADFALEVVSSNQKIKDGRTVRQLLIDTYAENEKKDREEGHGGHAGNNGQQSLETDNAELEKASIKDMKKGKKFPTPFYQQTYVLAKRTFIQRRGDLLGWDRIIQVAIISVLAGLLWIRRDTTEDQIADRTGFLFFSTMFWIMNTWFNALYAFPPERAVLNKERATGSYRLSAYFMGKVFAETPLELVLPIVFACITYWMVGLSPRADTFILYIIYLCLFALLGSGIGLLIGATVLDVKKALTASVIIVLGSVLLGGFFIAQENLRVWIRWARWTSFMKYTYELMLLNEFDLGDQNYTPSTPSTYSSNPITGSDILNRLNVETKIWADIIFIVGVIILTRFLAYLSLRFLNKPKS